MDRAKDHALLVEGFPDGNGTRFGPGRLSVVAEVLRAAGSRWTVRSLLPASVSCGALRDELVDACACVDSCLLVVICGVVVRTHGLALRVSRGSGPDAAFSFDELARSLNDSSARQVVVVVALDDDGATQADEVAGRLASEERAVVVSVGRAIDLLASFTEALRGAARDARCGVITLASLAAYLAPHAPALRMPDSDRLAAPWLEPPSLEQMWHLGWSTRTVAPASQPTPADAADPLLGAILPGRFRIDAVIAAGSFGLVYRGHQLAVDRDVAIKVIRAGVDPFSEDGRQFVHEIQAVARIDHRNVVRVYQADITADGRLFFAMELLAGRDLQAVLADGPIEPARSLALLAQLLAALEAAHQAGLVHADVKPGNTMVVPDRHGERLVLVDFGLARLRKSEGETASVGGTPAFMAPEQLQAGHVDARSDQFSSALVLVMLLTGWRRRRATELAPPPEVLAQVSDALVRAALARALAITPGDRFASVASFAAAMTGQSLDGVEPPRRPPFHGLAPLTEDDRGHLHGRDRDLAQLTDLVFHHPLVIVTAPSGVGKTSLLRAGLVPRLGALHTEAHYASCRTADEHRAAQAIRDGALTLTDAFAAHVAGRFAVLVVDQVEDVLDGATPSGLVDASVAIARGADPTAHVILGVREDFLARLLDRLPGRGDGVSIMRIGPLDRDGARTAIVRPLAEARLVIEPELLECLLTDLVAAGLRLGSELGWAAAQPVYPPHLQLACSVLYDRLPLGEQTVTIAQYRAAGGFNAIVSEHLERVLGAFEATDGAIAREVLLSLVGTRQLRAARTDDDLRTSIVGVEPHRVEPVLEILRRQGLIVRARRPGGELVWEIIHDSLVPRVLEWLDRHDLARRSAMENVRHHLRRGQDARSILTRAELREVDAHPGLVDVLERDWGTRNPGSGPRALIARSRTLHRRSRAAAVALVATVVAGVGVAAYERARISAETTRRDRNIGRVTLELSAFDGDPLGGTRLVAILELPALAWTLHRHSPGDPDIPGDPMPGDLFERLFTIPTADGLLRRDTVEAQGGRAVLVVTGRGRPGESCAPSIIPLQDLPGYAGTGSDPPILSIRIPTCRATLTGTIEIPEGPFLFGGPGEPPQSQKDSPAREVERVVEMPRYRIDRTEVTNAAFAAFAAMQRATGIGPRSYPSNSDAPHISDARSPATLSTWREAAAYCRFLGKRLPTSAEWEKAMRGGTSLDGKPNPFPRRNYPWGNTARGDEANLKRTPEVGALPVGSFAADVSPYGVLDLAGNVHEWIGSPETGASAEKFFAGTVRVTRGGNWDETTPAELASYLAIENARDGEGRVLRIGWRCALAP